MFNYYKSITFNSVKSIFLTNRYIFNKMKKGGTQIFLKKYKPVPKDSDGRCKNTSKVAQIKKLTFRINEN